MAPRKKKLPEDDIETPEGRLAIVERINELSSMVVTKTVSDIMREAFRVQTATLQAASEMLPLALQTVSDVMTSRFLGEGAGTRLKAALEILSIFGISGKKKIEITKHDKTKAPSEIVNEFEREIAQHIQNAHERAATGLPQGNAVPEILDKPARSLSRDIELQGRRQSSS